MHVYNMQVLGCRNVPEGGVLKLWGGSKRDSREEGGETHHDVGLVALFGRDVIALREAADGGPS